MDELFKRAWSVEDWAAFTGQTPRTIWRYCDDPAYCHLKFPKPDIRSGNFVRWMPGTAKAWIDQFTNRGKQQRDEKPNHAV